MNPARLFLTGARDTLPLIRAATPFGIVYGALPVILLTVFVVICVTCSMPPA
jgi:hypothetical protein